MFRPFNILHGYKTGGSSSLLYPTTHLTSTHRYVCLKHRSTVNIAQMQSKSGRFNNCIQQDDGISVTLQLSLRTTHRV